MKKTIPYIAAFALILILGFANQAGALSIIQPIQGGTGASSTPLSGQVPIGTSAGIYIPANITCTSGCTIATSSGGIAITGTASGATSATTTINAGGATSTGPAFIITLIATTTDNAVQSDGNKTITISILASTTWTKTANNLSDLNSPSTARTNLGLGTAATHPATDFLQTANNLSDLANTSTARTNIGYQGSTNVNIAGNGAISITGQIPVANGGSGTSTTPTDSQVLSANGSTPTWKNVSGTAHQVNVATSTNGFTFSTPQNIDTNSSVQFGDITLSESTTNHIGNFGGTVQNLAAYLFNPTMNAFVAPQNENAIYLAPLFSMSNNTSSSQLTALYFQSSTVSSNPTGTAETDQIYIQGPINGTTTPTANQNYSIHVASGTSRFDGPVQIPYSTNTSFTNGQIQISSATDTAEYGAGGGSFALSPTSSISYAAVSSSLTGDDFLWESPSTYKFTDVEAVNKTSGDSCAFNLQFDLNRSSSTAQGAQSIFNATDTVTASTSSVSLAINGSSTITKGQILRLASAPLTANECDITISLQALP